MVIKVSKKHMPPSSEQEVKMFVLAKATVHHIPEDQNMNLPPPHLKPHISDDIRQYYRISYSENKNEIGVGVCGKYRLEQKCTQYVGGENLK